MSQVIVGVSTLLGVLVGVVISQLVVEWRFRREMDRRHPGWRGRR